MRYADDCMIFCKSERAAERILESISKFIEGKLFLKVNHDKTGTGSVCVSYDEALVYFKALVEQAKLQ